MLYCNDSDGNKIKAEYGKSYKDIFCPCCNGKVSAKVKGNIIAPHFAHYFANSCPSKPMSKWHLDWQNIFPSENREIYKKRDDGYQDYHLADVQLNNGLVIEFQHSSFSLTKMIERERFWNTMIWVIDASKLMPNNRVKNDMYQDLIKEGFISLNIKIPIKKNTSLSESIPLKTLDIIKQKFSFEYTSFCDNVIGFSDGNIIVNITMHFNSEYLYENVLDITKKNYQLVSYTKPIVNDIKFGRIINSIPKSIEGLNKPIFVDNLEGLDKNYLLYLNGIAPNKHSFISKSNFINKLKLNNK